MSVTASKGGIVRQMTCSQFALLAPGSGWTLVASNCGQEYTNRFRSPYASFPIASGSAPAAPSGLIVANVSTPTDTVAIPAGRLLTNIVILYSTGSPTVSVGTTAGGRQIIDAETPDNGASFDQSAYFDTAGLLYFTTTGDLTVRIYTEV